LVGELEHLDDLLLRVESINKRTFLGNFKEFDEQVLLFHAAIADAELHEQVLQTYLGRVVVGSHTHCEDPEGDRVINSLCLCEAVVQERYAHFKDYRTAGLVSQKLFKHVYKGFIHLLCVQLQ